MTVLHFCTRAVAPGFVALLVALVGCGDPGDPDGSEATPGADELTAPVRPSGGSGGAGGGGGGDCGSGGQGGEGGTVDVNDPCTSMSEPGAPPARVVWVTEPQPTYKLTSPMSLQWAFQYAARAPLADRADTTLDYEVCETPAHQDTTCSTSTLALPADECAVVYAPRFGVDSSQYRRGINLYSITLRLRQGCAVQSEDTISWTVEYKPNP